MTNLALLLCKYHIEACNWRRQILLVHMHCDGYVTVESRSFQTIFHSLELEFDLWSCYALQLVFIRFAI